MSGRRAARGAGAAVVCGLLIVWTAGGLGLVSAPADEPAAPRERLESIARWAMPAPMVTIPAGWFLMGTPHVEEILLGFEGPYDDTEQPQRRIWLDAYEIDRDEVSLGNYLAWVLRASRPLDLQLARELAATRRLSDETLSGWPAFHLRWYDADDYCRSLGKRLPSEAEWEKAARGTMGQIFPWGTKAPSRWFAVFNLQIEDSLLPLAPVDSLAEGRSPYGLHHMAGNVAEWVQDWGGVDSYATMPERNPTGPSGGRYKIVRGGSWRSGQAMLRAATRGGAPPMFSSSTIGFRCARSLP